MVTVTVLDLVRVSGDIVKVRSAEARAFVQVNCPTVIDGTDLIRTYFGSVNLPPPTSATCNPLIIEFIADKSPVSVIVSLLSPVIATVFEETVYEESVLPILPTSNVRTPLVMVPDESLAAFIHANTVVGPPSIFKLLRL
jgi:hypothetical protein